MSLLYWVAISLQLVRAVIMARQNRRNIFDPNDVGAFHAV